MDWDVSSVRGMGAMFYDAAAFNGDISKWDVSNVQDMGYMFLGAKEFNGDISKWNVSSVNNMQSMFLGAESFKRTLCEVAWVHSKASKNLMFAGSSGSISKTVCMTTPVFSPQSKTTPVVKPQS